MKWIRRQRLLSHEFSDLNLITGTHIKVAERINSKMSFGLHRHKHAATHPPLSHIITHIIVIINYPGHVSYLALPQHYAGHHK